MLHVPLRARHRRRQTPHGNRRRTRQRGSRNHHGPEPQLPLRRRLPPHQQILPQQLYPLPALPGPDRAYVPPRRRGIRTPQTPPPRVTKRSHFGGPTRTKRNHLPPRPNEPVEPPDPAEAAEPEPRRQHPRTTPALLPQRRTLPRPPARLASRPARDPVPRPGAS